MSPEPSVSTFDLATAVGLSDDEAGDRLRRDGHNELPASKPRSLFAIALEVVREPMFLLLVASGSLYLLLGDLTEGLLLLAFVFVVMGITLYQERKTERALEALRDLSSPRALVIRSGGRKRIPGREVVRGDLVMLAEGDRVPADAVLLDSTGLTVDESLLTGESVPVRKRATSVLAGDLRDLAIRGEAVAACSPKRRRGGGPSVFSGTLVVQGQGVAERAGDRRRHGTREDRARPPDARSRRIRRLQRETGTAGARPRHLRRRALRARRRRLRPDARRLAARPARRPHARDGHAAGGVPGGADDLPRARRVADLAAPGADAARRRRSRRWARPRCSAWTRPARSH